MSWPDEQKEPDFDALRGRADLQKPVAELEAKHGPKAKEGDRSRRLAAESHGSPTRGRSWPSDDFPRHGRKGMADLR